jgi:hypothetical protein
MPRASWRGFLRLSLGGTGLSADPGLSRPALEQINFAELVGRNRPQKQLLSSRGSAWILSVGVRRRAG